jgi:hypothetical protein
MISKRRKSRRPSSEAAQAYAECHRRPRCQAAVAAGCSGRNEHAHHKQLRSQQGPTTSENLLAVCLNCHEWIHAHPAESYRLGFMVRANAQDAGGA